MPKNTLTALGVKAAQDGKMFDGAGITLIKKDGRGKWVYRYSHLKKRREMGLGSYPEVSLSDARKARDKWAGVLSQGLDPISTRNAQQADQVAERNKKNPTFEEMAYKVFDAKKAGWRGEGTRGRWLSPLIMHVFPKMGRKRMSEIHQSDIHDTLKPIWKTMPPTAKKAFDRIGTVFKQARLMGIECDPFIVEASRHMLGVVIHKHKHIAATPWQEIPALYHRLDSHAGSSLCLRWMILTLVRSTGCRGARFDEIDGETWTVPAVRMKGSETGVSSFRVPLSDQALDIVRICGETSGEFLFPSNRGGKGLSDNAIHKILKRENEAGRPHGFRTSFRTWAQDTDQPWDVAETILAHTIGGKVERSYARSDLLDRRRIVMDKWADYVTQAESSVVTLYK
jgi:integrase